MASPASSDARATDAALAIFDLDGTLTRRDTALPYLSSFLATRPARWPRLFSVFGALVAFAAGRVDRDRCKERIISVCLGSATREELAEHTERFVTKVLARGMSPRALAVLEAHRAARARLVLLSASPDVYVRALATRLGFDECLCTELRWGSERLIGTFTTANRRGEEKARLVRGLKAEGRGSIAAYANSSSDIEHLELVDFPLLVNGSKRARRLAAARGMPCADWS
jgi:HAD superfamily hydrolase (TIGR01490 family)